MTMVRICKTYSFEALRKTYMKQLWFTIHWKLMVDFRKRNIKQTRLGGIHLCRVHEQTKGKNNFSVVFTWWVRTQSEPEFVPHWLCINRINIARAKLFSSYFKPECDE